MSSWQIIDSGPLSAEAIMAKDAALLASLTPESPSLLHLYEWKDPCLTYGYFIDPARFLEMDALQEFKIQKARRPTGGGIIFHLTDFAFSLLLPSSHPCLSLNPLDNYAFINQEIAKIIADFFPLLSSTHLFTSAPSCSKGTCQNFCMANLTKYDVIIEGKKVGGAAERRTKQGLLHQATLCLSLPPLDLLKKVLKNQEEVIKAMWMNSYCLLSKEAKRAEIREMRGNLKKILSERIFLIK